MPQPRRITLLLALPAVLFFSASAASPATPASPRETVTKLVALIQKADYEGDRPALQRLYGELTPFINDKDMASRVRYWRGFALWRRSINGFNDNVDPKELEQDLKLAVDEFTDSSTKDPAFADAKVGQLSCLGNILYLNMKNATRVQEIAAQAQPLVKDLNAAAPENPRFLWVLGPIYWSSPPERGGSQSKAIDIYLKGLESVRKNKNTKSDPLDPSWGEPELLMSLAWSNKNGTTPDLNAAEQYAHSALQIVPYWHYVRDILLPQILEAKAKQS